MPESLRLEPLCDPKQSSGLGAQPLSRAPSFQAPSPRRKTRVGAQVEWMLSGFPRFHSLTLYTATISPPPHRGLTETQGHPKFPRGWAKRLLSPSAGAQSGQCFFKGPLGP